MIGQLISGLRRLSSSLNSLASKMEALDESIEVGNLAVKKDPPPLLANSPGGGQETLPAEPSVAVRSPQKRVAKKAAKKKSRRRK